METLGDVAHIQTGSGGEGYHMTNSSRNVHGQGNMVAIETSVHLHCYKTTLHKEQEIPDSGILEVPKSLMK